MPRGAVSRPRLRRKERKERKDEARGDATGLSDAARRQKELVRLSPATAQVRCRRPRHRLRRRAERISQRRGASCPQAPCGPLACDRPVGTSSSGRPARAARGEYSLHLGARHRALDPERVCGFEKTLHFQMLLGEAQL